MELLNYQKEIYERIRGKPSVALYMEAGTGKTIMSQYTFEHNGTSKCMIFCLASKVDEFKFDCIDYFGEDYKIETLNKGTANNKLALLNGSDIYICSFQSALNIKNELVRAISSDWTIIIDESHKIKNHRSQISKLMHKVGTKTKYKLILTGTPQNKGYIDYFSQFKFLGVFNTLTDFQNRFCVMDTVRYGSGISFLDIVGYKNTEDLDKIIDENAVFFKRERAEDEVPIQKYVYFEKPKIYNKFLKDRVYKDVGCVNMGVLRLRARQLCSGFIKNHIIGSDKDAWISEFINETNENNRIVIFYSFDEERDKLIEICQHSGRPYSVYSGKIKEVDNFNNEENSVIIVNYASGGTGINWLSKAHVGIFYSPPESYLDFEQARKRLDRLGQKNRAMFYCLRTRDSVEDIIYKNIENKEDFDDEKFKKYLERSGLNV